MEGLWSLVGVLVAAAITGGVAAFGALLVFRRAGQTIAVARDDSVTKRFEAISAAQDRASAGQERVRVALLARLDEFEAENAALRTQVASNADQMIVLRDAHVALKLENEACLQENQRQAVRLSELERLVISYRNQEQSGRP